MHSGGGFRHKTTKMRDPSRLAMVTGPFTATLERQLENALFSVHGAIDLTFFLFAPLALPVHDAARRIASLCFVW
jgi:hypothetical protein